MHRVEISSLQAAFMGIWKSMDSAMSTSSSNSRAEHLADRNCWLHTPHHTSRGRTEFLQASAGQPSLSEHGDAYTSPRQTNWETADCVCTYLVWTLILPSKRVTQHNTWWCVPCMATISCSRTVDKSRSCTAVCWSACSMLTTILQGLWGQRRVQTQTPRVLLQVNSVKR